MQIFHQKKARVAILISDKIDFKTKAVKRVKEGCYIMIKGSTQKEEITIKNIHAPIKGAWQYVRQMLTSTQFHCLVAQPCPTRCDTMNCSMPGLPVRHQLPESTQTHIHRVNDTIQPSLPLLSLLLLPPIILSIRFFSNESTLCMMWPKYWGFSFNISPSNENLGLISFRMDWLDFPAVQETLKSLSNKTVQKHQFFGVQLS